MIWLIWIVSLKKYFILMQSIWAPELMCVIWQVYCFGVFGTCDLLLPRGHSSECTRSANILLFSLALPLPCPLSLFTLPLLRRFSALTFTGHNHFVCDFKVDLDNSKKINYLLNRLRAMPLTNFTPNQFCDHVFLSLSKRAP